MNDIVSIALSVLVLCLVFYMLYLTRDVKKILDKMIKRNKKYDKDIEEALRLLENLQEYYSILGF